ncbi:hypothetical protein HN031_09245 [Nocardioides sp. zg-1308]|uniref:hypothetical protein n=1 Tax=Nocardioides sp. zg-1308 TaxID=2736253 RepID=UPI001552635E|nr:hypothetical protein [Nocardioides sp. zg-1308]NPD04865.1 hypothetical protein [Nocardioides sp. zg-1308]
MATHDFGPFTVSAERVTLLGSAFTAFVNRLLSAEVEAAGLAGPSLQETYRDNVSDEGVDAALVSEVTTKWIPAGESAWQFKAGDLRPAQCRSELRGATFAQEILRRGGHYRLVLGASLTAAKLTKRRAALIEEAKTLELEIDDESIQILHADSLASWTESFPALAVWPVLGGLAHGTMTFETWAASNRHTAAFVESVGRTEVQDAIRALVSGGEAIDLRLTGVSGLGKTRLALETFRGSGLESLIVYLKADDSPRGVLTHLLSQHRSGIVVLDECSRDLHKSLAEVIPAGSRLRLITIGEPDSQGGLIAPVFALAPFDAEAMDSLIERNQPSLRAEVRRFIVEIAEGNIGYALYVAQHVARNPEVRTADLVTPEAIAQFVSQSLPTGSDFLACSVLALLSRIGYEGELAGELELLAEVFGFSPTDLRAAARSLTEAGLLSSHGRYRAVTPHPMAVYLASAAWSEYSDRIVRDLLPRLSPSMSARLFRRAADIGEFGPTRSAVVRLLNNDGPFASLEEIERTGSSDLLTELAMVAPREVSRMIAGMLAEADEDELRGRTSIRRGLVWTLDKLVWHTYTFEEAADSLLRLALAENETWSNNATGNWVELFGLMLPATAAKPLQRLGYLGRAVVNTDPRVRLLAVRASAQALSIRETIMLSGELQRGFLVEGRGQPETWEEVSQYRSTALDHLAVLAADSDPDVAASAIDKLVSTIHPILEHEPLREHLTAIISALGGSALERTRVELENLSGLFERVGQHHHLSDGDQDVDTSARRDGLDAMRRALPQATPLEDLRVLSRLRRWDIDSTATKERLLDIASQLDDPAAAILDILEAEVEVPAEFDLGKGLSQLSGGSTAVEERLALLARADRSAALVGYLWGRVEAGVETAFDDFLDGHAGQALPSGVRLALTARGPATDVARQRAESLSTERPVAEVVQMSFAVWREMPPAELADRLGDLVPRVGSQEDYNALLDFVSLSLHDDRDDSELQDIWVPLLALRAYFPSLGTQTWAWGQLATRAGRRHPVATTQLVLDLVDQDVLRLYAADEGEVLKVAVQAGGRNAWELVMSAIQAGNWKLTMGVDGWFGGLIELDQVRNWIGDNLDRARAVASVSTVGSGAEMNEVAVYLLSTFAEDRRIESSLYGEFVSGTWWGNESSRIYDQLTLIEGWRHAHADSEGVSHWCNGVVDSLRSRLSVVLREEAEEDRD